MPFDMFMSLYEVNQKYYAVLLGSKGDPVFTSKLKDAIKPILSRELIARVQVDAIKLDYILEYILTAMIGLMCYWYNQKNPIPKEEMYELVQTIMEQGVYKQLLE